MYQIYYNLIDGSLRAGDAECVDDVSEVKSLLSRMDDDSDIYIYHPYSRKRVLIYFSDEPGMFNFEVHSGSAVVYKKLVKNGVIDSLNEIDEILDNPYKMGFKDCEL